MNANGAIMAAPLSEQFALPSKRSKLIDDALEVLNAEVKDKSGISGLAVKGAFKVIQKVQPGFLRKVINHLLDDFMVQLEPLYQDALNAGLPPGGLLQKRKDEVASALLSVTDKKAQRSSSDIVKKTYAKLRPSAQKHVESATPRLKDLLNRHAATS